MSYECTFTLILMNMSIRSLYCISVFILFTYWIKLRSCFTACRIQEQNESNVSLSNVISPNVFIMARLCARGHSPAITSFRLSYNLPGAREPLEHHDPREETYENAHIYPCHSEVSPVLARDWRNRYGNCIAPSHRVVTWTPRARHSLLWKRIE